MEDEHAVTQVDEPEPLNLYRATITVYPPRIVGTIEVSGRSLEEARAEILRRFRDQEDTMQDARWEPLEIEEDDLRLLSIKEVVQ